MKILVLGGTRFFGKRLVKNLLAKGHQVSIFSRGKTEDDLGDKVTRCLGSRGNLADLQEASNKGPYDVVIDQICMTAEDADLAIQAFSGKTQHYVLTSTLSVYPFGANQKETDFDALKYSATISEKPLTDSEKYAEGKRAAEKTFLSKSPFSLAIMRIPVVVGLDDYTGRLKLHIEKVKQQKKIYFPNLDAKFSFIDSEDAARALEWLSTQKKSGVYNFASKDVLKLKEFISLIENKTGKKAVIASEPDPQLWSPFGIPSDWYMNVSKAESEGFLCGKLQDWLPKLIEDLAKT